MLCLAATMHGKGATELHPRLEWLRRVLKRNRQL